MDDCRPVLSQRLRDALEDCDIVSFQCLLRSATAVGPSSETSLSEHCYGCDKGHSTADIVQGLQHLIRTVAKIEEDRQNLEMKVSGVETREHFNVVYIDDLEERLKQSIDLCDAQTESIAQLTIRLSQARGGSVGAATALQESENVNGALTERIHELQKTVDEERKLREDSNKVAAQLRNALEDTRRRSSNKMLVSSSSPVVEERDIFSPDHTASTPTNVKRRSLASDTVATDMHYFSLANERAVRRPISSPSRPSSFQLLLTPPRSRRWPTRVTTPSSPSPLPKYPPSWQDELQALEAKEKANTYVQTSAEGTMDQGVMTENADSPQVSDAYVQTSAEGTMDQGIMTENADSPQVGNLASVNVETTAEVTMDQGIITGDGASPPTERKDATGTTAISPHVYYMAANTLGMFFCWLIVREIVREPVVYRAYT